MENKNLKLQILSDDCINYTPANSQNIQKWWNYWSYANIQKLPGHMALLDQKKRAKLAAHNLKAIWLKSFSDSKRELLAEKQEHIENN